MRIRIYIIRISQILIMAKSLIVDELPLEEFDILVNTIRNITPEQLMLLARRYLRPERYLTVTVG